MIITHRTLPRRTLLTSTGALLALPFLDAMQPALAAAVKSPSRLGYFYVPNGMHMPLWTPRSPGIGNDFVLNATMASLQSVKPYLTVLSHLNNYAAGLGDGGGPHTRNQSAWLSGVLAKSGESDVRLARTADQYAARVLGKDTPLESLEIATDPSDQVGSCDNGYSCLYVNTISWRDPTVPNPMERNPRVVFERLFGEESTVEARRKRLATDASILDTVHDSLASLGRQIGPSDRLRVEEYLSSIRDAERRIQKTEQQSLTAVDVTRPAGIPATFEDHTLLMFDLLFLAYQSDLTRVVTFSIAREQGNKNYNNIGVPEGHHESSHHQNDPHKQSQLTKINTYHLSLYETLLRKMATTPDGDGMLLDHAALVYGAGQSDGDLHSPLDLPVLVAGTLHGTVRGNQAIAYHPNQRMPLMNLHRTLLHGAGVDVPTLGDSTGLLSEL